MLDVPKREVELGAGLREIPQPGKVDATKGISGPIRNSILRNLKYVGIVRQAFINLAKNVQECRGLDMSWRDEEVLASYASRFKLHDDPNVRNRTWEHRLVDHEFFLESLLAPENDNPQIVTAFQRSGANLNQQRPGLRALKAKFLPSDRNVMFIDIGPGLGNEKPAITSQEIADRFPAVEVIALDTPIEVVAFTGNGNSAEVSHSVPQVQRKIAIHKPNFHILSGNGLEPLFAQVRDKSTNPLKSKSRPDLDTDTPVVIRAANSIDVYANWERSNGSSPCLRDVVAGIAKDFNANPIILLFNRSILFKEAGSIRWNIVGKVSRKGFSHNTRHISRGGEAPFMLYPERVERGAAQQLTDIVDQFGHGGIGKRVMFANEESPPPKHLVRARGVSEAGGLQTVYLKQDALKSFVWALKNPAKGHGIHLHIRTGFRSFDFQKKMLKLSPENAETPGFSEHHLGTAVDVTGVTRESEAFLYLLRNGEGTGWIPSQYFSPVATVKEPWHWRYVGVSAAEAFYKQWREVIQREIEFLTSLQEAGALCENPNLLKESR